MITNIFTNLPKVGDAVVGERSTKKVKFITLESFDKASLGSDYETIGAVYNRRGRKVKIVYKLNDVTEWAKKWVLKLSGYTLDDTSRTGVISFRPEASATENTDVTVTYRTATLQGLVAALNTAFAGNSAMVSQHWVAYINGSDVNIEHDYTFGAQASYNKAKSGFTGCNTCLAACSDVHKTHGLQQHPRSCRRWNLSKIYGDVMAAVVEKASYRLGKEFWLSIAQRQERISMRAMCCHRFRM